MSLGWHQVAFMPESGAAAAGSCPIAARRSAWVRQRRARTADDQTHSEPSFNSSDVNDNGW
jgi:hypothetical protein